MSRTPPAEIAAELREAITSGGYAPGTRLPSILRLSETYDVSLNFARRALRLLIDEGLAEAQHGSGHYVPPEAP